MKGRTSIPIAVDGARLDRILVLDYDIISKQGSHAALAKRPGRNLSAPVSGALFPCASLRAVAFRHRLRRLRR